MHYFVIQYTNLGTVCCIYFVNSRTVQAAGLQKNYFSSHLAVPETTIAFYEAAAHMFNCHFIQSPNQCGQANKEELET